MVCPLDQTQLVIADRQGIEIDYCPRCRGVWLDRGELDKLIERTNALGGAGRERSSEPEPRRETRNDYETREHHPHDDDDDYKEHGRGHKGHHKKESFLGDLFDF